MHFVYASLTYADKKDAQQQQHKVQQRNGLPIFKAHFCNSCARLVCASGAGLR